MARQERIQRLLFEVLKALSDGRLEEREVTSIMKKLAALIPARRIVRGGVDLLIDVLHQDADEMRAAADRKAERVKALREELEEELEDEGESKRARRLEKKIDDLEEDIDDLRRRAAEKDEGAE